MCVYCLVCGSPSPTASGGGHFLVLGSLLRFQAYGLVASTLKPPPEGRGNEWGLHRRVRVKVSLADEHNTPLLKSHHGYPVVNTLFPHDEAPTRLLVGGGWGPRGSELKQTKDDASMKICGYL